VRQHLILNGCAGLEAKIEDGSAEFLREVKSLKIFG